MLNTNIPSFKCLVRLSHFTKDEKDKGVYHNAYAFGIQSVEGKILTFHIMTDYGMLRSRVPISEIFLREPLNDIPNHYKQLWDCFSENVTVTRFDYLNGKRCQVALKDGTKVWCTYMFTLDWYNNPYSNEPTDYKCGHILVSDDGYLLCQPNNRIYWKDSNWITQDFPIEKKNIKVDNNLESVESYSDRWVSEDGDSFYYDINLKKKNMIRLFDINNGQVVPSEHCYTLRELKAIMDAYPDDYHNIYAYIFYMTCPNPDLNPFFDTQEHEKEELIISQLTINFSLEDDLIIDAKRLCETLYQTPTFRAYMGIKTMLDKLASYMGNSEITDGRDGNITAIVNAAAKFEPIRLSFRGAYKDLMEEQKSSVRGGQNLGYDQM